MANKDDEHTTGIGNIDRKMEMLTSLLDNTLRTYHNPVSFLAQVDALIQALRNFTWTIQANKANVKDFEAWYEPWQQRMKKQPYLRWLNDARVDIVHKDTLTAKSRATLELNSDYAQKFTTKYFDVMMPTEEIIEKEKRVRTQLPYLNIPRVGLLENITSRLKVKKLMCSIY